MTTRSLKRFRTVRLAGACAALLALPGLAGCAAKNQDILQFLRSHEHEVSAIEYRVGIPDVIEISAPQALEIDNETQQVQPDGKITLQLLGEVKIVGMTAREIAAKLEVLLSRYYVDPKVSVRVAGYASKVYYVTGVANSVGPRRYTGRDTLLDAVLKGGLNYMCWTSKVKVIRPSPEVEGVQTIVVDVDKMIKTGDWGQNVLLEPNDVVHVPPTPLAWLGLRLQEVLFPLDQVRDAYLYPTDWMAAQDVYENKNWAAGATGRGRTR